MAHKREYRIKKLERNFNGKSEVFYQAQYTEYFLFFKYWVNLGQKNIHKCLAESKIENDKKYETKMTTKKIYYF